MIIGSTSKFLRFGVSAPGLQWVSALLRGLDRYREPDDLFVDKIRRTKLSHDPNNTAWSRSTSKYGQKILESQGWLPGHSLGVANASYAAPGSHDNSSHIRVALKDDNLGLGARNGSYQGNGKTTGLDVFHDILGRLNGKSGDEIGEEQYKRSKVQRAAFVDNRWGQLPFVSGGLLVGDRLQECSKQQPLVSQSDKKASGDENISTPAETKGQDRSPPKVSVKIDRRNSICLEQQGHLCGKYKSEWGVCNKMSNERSSDDDSSNQELIPVGNRATTRLEKTQAKTGKAERKRQRKLRRGIRHQKSKPPAALAPPQPYTSSLQEVGGEAISLSATTEDTKRRGAPKAIASDRISVRQRYIQHKKMSLIDRRALNEVRRPPHPSLSPQNADGA